MLTFPEWFPVLDFLWISGKVSEVKQRQTNKPTNKITANFTNKHINKQTSTVKVLLKYMYTQIVSFRME